MKVRSHLAVMAAAILLPVAVFSGLALDQMLKAEREAVLRSMREAARATTLAIDRDWSYGEGVARALSSSAQLPNDDLAGFYAQAQSANRGKFFHTVLLDVDGQQLLNTVKPFGSAIISPTPAAQARVRNVLSKQSHQISNLIIGRATGKPVVTIEVPVTLASGRQYVISEWMYAAYFKQAFPTQGVPPSWLIGIFDRAGVTISRNRGPEDFIGKQPKGDLLQAILTGSRSYIKNQSRDGIELYTVLVRSPQSGWTVAVGVPAEEIESTARKAVVLAALGLLAAIGIAIGGAWLFGRRLVTAINRAAQAAALLGQSKLPTLAATGVQEVDNVYLALRDAGMALQRTEHERIMLLIRAREAQTLAERQNKAKDDFLAMLGHELRNPLSAITASVALIAREDIAPEASKRVREVIKRQSGMLTHIVDDLLDASRVVTGKVTLSIQRIDLREIAHACLNALRARGLTTQYQLDASIVQVWVDGDPTRIAQVINNLLENAFKYTPAGGRISLRVGSDDDQAVVSVCDSGIGISSELLPHIFDVFVQAPMALDRAKGGLGIGLAVVQAMVQQHAGRVTAESDGEGRGSCFEVRLPLSAGIATTAAPLSSPRQEVRKGMKLLVIDDNDDAREMLAQLLSLQGVEVIQASNGEDGIRLAEALQPDCAIVDIGLPGIDGYQVALRLRAAPHNGGMRLIALTGYGQPTDKEKTKSAGFDRHLNKPVDLEQLLDAIFCQPLAPDL